MICLQSAPGLLSLRSVVPSSSHKEYNQLTSHQQDVHAESSSVLLCCYMTSILTVIFLILAENIRNDMIYHTGALY